MGTDAPRRKSGRLWHTMCGKIEEASFSGIQMYPVHISSHYMRIREPPPKVLTLASCIIAVGIGVFMNQRNPKNGFDFCTGLLAKERGITKLVKGISTVSSVKGPL